MHKHTNQFRGPVGTGSNTTTTANNNGNNNRGPVRRWNSFHGGGGGGGVGMGGGGVGMGACGGGGGGGSHLLSDAVGNGAVVAGSFVRTPQEPFRAVPKAVQALRSESVDRSHRAPPPPPPTFPRRRFSVW